MHVECHDAIVLGKWGGCIFIEIEVHVLYVGNLGAVSGEVLDLLLTILPVEQYRVSIAVGVLMEYGIATYL